jgi:hypothetical protein
LKEEADGREGRRVYIPRGIAFKFYLTNVSLIFNRTCLIAGTRTRQILFFAFKAVPGKTPDPSLKLYDIVKRFGPSGLRCSTSGGARLKQNRASPASLSRK